MTRSKPVDPNSDFRLVAARVELTPLPHAFKQGVTADAGDCGICGNVWDDPIHVRDAEHLARERGEHVAKLQEDNRRLRAALRAVPDWTELTPEQLEIELVVWWNHYADPALSRPMGELIDALMDRRSDQQALLFSKDEASRLRAVFENGRNYAASARAKNKKSAP